jgi:hypothetical protein
MIASSHYISKFIDYPLVSQVIADKLDTVYNGKVRIIVIDDSYTEVNSYKIGNSISNDYIVFTFPTKVFFDEENIDKILIKNKFIHQFIFIFKDRDYANIVCNLSLFNIIVSGGSNTKNHFLSPIQLRLARFLIAILPVTGKDVGNSFHSNSINQKAGYDYTSKEAKKKRRI